MKQKMSIQQIFTSLSDKSTLKGYVKTRVIKITLGSSVIRVFVKDTKKDVALCLEQVVVDNLSQITTQPEYDTWHLQQVETIYKCLASRSINIDRLTEEGLKFGHATKIINIYINLIVFYSPYFPSNEVDKLKYFLHVPLDGKVFDALKAGNIKSVPKGIKYVNENSYYSLQQILRNVATDFKIPAVFFDEYAWTLEKAV